MVRLGADLARELSLGSEGRALENRYLEGQE
jgi:hypothetical protein